MGVNLDYREGEIVELGEKLKRERLALGLSQRQLSGDRITRNMLSQIESGTARPSMDTLAYLAGRLGKPISYFLEETALFSPNQQLMLRAREDFCRSKWAKVLELLADYREPDALFDQERWLMEALAALALGEDALVRGRERTGAELLEKAESAMDRTIYRDGGMERRMRLLAAKIDLTRATELLSIDEELCLRAKLALAEGATDRAGALLEAVEDRTRPGWAFLRGGVYFAQRDYRAAAKYYHIAENAGTQKAVPRLEICYRELGDFKMAYEYACKGR